MTVTQTHSASFTIWIAIMRACEGGKPMGAGVQNKDTDVKGTLPKGKIGTMAYKGQVPEKKGFQQQTASRDSSRSVVAPLHLSEGQFLPSLTALSNQQFFALQLTCFKHTFSPELWFFQLRNKWHLKRSQTGSVLQQSHTHKMKPDCQNSTSVISL